MIQIGKKPLRNCDYSQKYPAMICESRPTLLERMPGGNLPHTPSLSLSPPPPHGKGRVSLRLPHWGHGWLPQVFPCEGKLSTRQVHLADALCHFVYHSWFIG